MTAGRQSKSTLISWVAVDLAFILIIVALLGSFAYNSRKSSVSRSREELIHRVTEWAFVFDELRSSANVAGNALYKSLPAASESAIPQYLTNTMANTMFSHVVYVKNGSAVYDENGVYSGDLDLPGFSGGEPMSVTMRVLHAGEYLEHDSYALIYHFSDSSYLVFIASLNDISEIFASFAYTEYMFLVLISNDGTLLASFDKYNDTDSVFLSSPNILSVVSGGADVEDFTLYKTKLSNLSGCAVSSTVRNDARTIVSVPVKETDVVLTLGLRQFYMNKMIASDFKATQSAVIRLLVVIVLFSIFAFGTLVASSIKHKEHGRELEDKADTDLLTELYNKLATERKIQEYIDEHPKSSGMFFIFDVDNFKKINDTMGHAFGDLMLKTIGTQIRSVFRVTDIIGRIGGDEFIIFLKDVKESEVKEQADRLTSFFHDFKAGGDYVKYSATASIGAALYPEDGKSFKGLYEAADQALYKAKKRGKNRLVFFNEKESAEGEQQA
ncbi:MAG: GGDEF domain-containing protein [Lachnospiraceae bacterium]|nr:GGDEF domain-containing protein [Lachnospiraceae bacterium]